MTHIYLQTKIKSSQETCFNLARSVEAHMLSTAQSNEKAIAGRLSGLCESGDRITWQATHFGITQQLSVEILNVQTFHHFEDRMTKGAFKSMFHTHDFEFNDGICTMTDNFYYEVPYGIFGKLFDRFVLRKYMRRLLLERNAVLRKLAENKKGDELI